MTYIESLNRGWTDARVLLLKDFAERGLSASRIAHELVGVSRSAVIGKLYRLSTPTAQREKLSPEEKLRRRSERRSKRGNQNIVRRIEAVQNQKREPAPPRKDLTPAERMAAAHAQREKIAHLAANELTDLPAEDAAAAVRFENLNGNTCRWPIGDPQNLETIRFCGKGISTQSYCAHHYRMAHRPRGFA